MTSEAFLAAPSLAVAFPGALWWLFAAVGLAAAAATLPGTLELALVTAGCWRVPPGSRRGPRPALRRVAVVVPAHDEEAGIARCVRSLLLCDDGGFDAEVVVVADNCSDSTAAAAADAGARVLERNDPTKRGKGYALAWAFERLLREGVDAVVVVDADTSVRRNFLTAVVDRLDAGAAAVQVPYGVRNADESARTRLMNLALLAFNRCRPRGRAGVGLSAGILGNGFALPRATLARIPWNASSVVEDLEYHLRLVDAGLAVEWADETEVLADMPVGERAAASQRVRWEGGRLRMVAEHAPRLLGGIARGQFRLAEPLLELLLPPLAMHVALLALAAATPLPAVRAWAALALAVVVAHVLTAALRCGRGWIDLAAVASAPRYVAWKLMLLPAVLRGASRSAAWVRTDRDAAAGGAR